jgi:hypothetical protein
VSKKCTPCISEALKAAIKQVIKDPEIIKSIDAAPNCPSGVQINLCGKKGRARSEYQEFTGNCLRAKHLTQFDPNALKDCARQWREQHA